MQDEVNNQDQTIGSSKFSSDIHRKQKEQTNLFTADVTEETKSQFMEQQSFLSNLILNYQQFWHQKRSHLNKQNSAFHQLHINSKMGDNPFFNEYQKNAFEKKKHKSSLLCLQSKKSFPDYDELGLATQVEVEELSESVTNEQSSISIQRQDNGQFSKMNREQMKGQKMEQILLKMKSIQEIALTGYWCSLYLSESKVRWQLVSILLYKEAAKLVSKLKIPLGSNDKNREKSVGEEINYNINKMQQKYLKSHTISQGLKQIFIIGANSRKMFVQIIKESKNFISDIMKESFTIKTYQFCLFKVLQAIFLLAQINGFEAIERSDNFRQFSVQELKKKLLQYKDLQSRLNSDQEKGYE